MDDTQAHIPEFNASQPASQNGRFTPVQKPKMPFDKKKIAVTLILLLAIVVPIVTYYVNTRNQTRNSEAVECPLTTEPNGRQCNQVPGCQPYVYIECSRDGSKKCVQQGDTFAVGVCPNRCKRLTPCTEKCRLENGLEVINNTCESEPTPSTPSVCTSPNECVDAETAKARGCETTSTSANGPQQCTLSTPGSAGYCCSPVKPTETPTPTDRPTDTPTPTPTETPTPSPTPTPPDNTPTVTPPVTPACVYPIIDVEVECAVCAD